MTDQSQTQQAACHGKISREFARRLAELAPNETIRAVVLPGPYVTSDSAPSRHERVRGEERAAVLREARQQTEENFTEVDEVLEQTGGQRLNSQGNALGYILVETTAAGIAALSGLPWVGTLLEDQAMRPTEQPS